MLRSLFAIILIAIAIAGFFVFANPLFSDINALKAQAVSYDQALANSKALENARDTLTQEENSISPDDLDRLEKLLPDNVDNIRLILEIEKVAQPYGMVLKDVKYDATQIAKTGADAADSQVVQSGDTAAMNPKDYGIWNLQFTTEGTYDSFLSFLRDLESNLRIIDIANIQFQSNSGSGATPGLIQSYRYQFTIKTYWLKD